MGDPAKTLIQTHVKNDEKTKIISFFVSNSVDEHIASLDTSYIYYNALEFLEERIRELRGGNISSLLSHFIILFSNCASFDAADKCFDKLIRPNIQSFSVDDFKSIIDKVNLNYQLYHRRRARDDNTLIYNCAKSVLPDDFDFGSYSNFKYSVEDAETIEPEEVDDTSACEELPF